MVLALVSISCKRDIDVMKEYTFNSVWSSGDSSPLMAVCLGGPNSNIKVGTPTDNITWRVEVLKIDQKDERIIIKMTRPNEIPTIHTMRKLWDERREGFHLMMSDEVGNNVEYGFVRSYIQGECE